MNSSTKPIFQIISGGEKKPPPLLDVKPVEAISPFSKSETVKYRVNTADMASALDQKLRRQAFDFWALVAGLAPPVPNISKHLELSTTLEKQALGKALHCFRGVKRPNGKDTRGFDTVIYISKPKLGFRFRANMVCLAVPYDIPQNFVLATYVKLDFPDGRNDNVLKARKSTFKGVITHWELIEADTKDNTLPIGHLERYRKKMW